jgi:hypothetical protein
MNHLITVCNCNKCSNLSLTEIDNGGMNKVIYCCSHSINQFHITGTCKRVCWKNTVRKRICNKPFYKNEMCYYHYSKANPNQIKWWKGNEKSSSSKNRKK